MGDDSDCRRKDQAALVPSLLAMTVVTGIVDAVSILRLGHVFVANMTGNVVFLGFALTGASGFSVLASLVAIGSFLVGAAVGGRSVAGTQRQVLGRIAGVEGALCAAATVVAATSSGTAARYAMTVLLALAMGCQNATARKLAVSDMTTTVLTLTLTGLAADPPRRRPPRIPHPAARRRGRRDARGGHLRRIHGAQHLDLLGPQRRDRSPGRCRGDNSLGAEHVGGLPISLPRRLHGREFGTLSTEIAPKRNVLGTQASGVKLLPMSWSTAPRAIGRKPWSSFRSVPEMPINMVQARQNPRASPCTQGS